nr:immunoglobulin light chain junction region [Macaca mulatta]MOX77806.1 immunoglobulin light chain junction region [Macaca mulatta]MOX79003.1 immunoglobulin light chain junction region [Macaca mulatta]MOX79187.1 immunoglobulin light chain junction region [Macaca mulatta]MOX79420.1 immunoglobulin light chain junction region [Macaca mulatta]
DYFCQSSDITLNVLF